jgi:hypothetical protein
MEREVQILQDLFIPVLRKDELFDASKCDGLFWNKITSEFINFEQDKKPFYASIYSLELADAEKIINKLENLQLTFLEQLAEENVLGNTSAVIVKLEQTNPYFNEKVQFYKNLEKAIILSERKRIKSELPTMFEKYSFEMDENLLAMSIAKNERQILRDKMKDWDEELIESNSDLHTIRYSLSSEKKSLIFEEKNDKVKVISFSWIKYAVAACFVLGIGFWFYTSQNEIDLPVNPVVTKPNEEDSSLQLPKPVLVESSKNTKLTDVLVNEGLGFSNTSKQIKIVTINNNERILSIYKAIEIYQNYIEKELLTSSDNDLKTKKVHAEIKKEIDALQLELDSLQTNQDTYLFDGKSLTLYDVEQTNITVVAYNKNYYLKKGTNFYSLTKTDVPLKFSKVNENSLKDNLEQILFTNGE